LKPRLRSLLETIDGFIETTDKRGISAGKSWRLVHVNKKIKVTVKKSVVDINMMNWPRGR